MNPEEPTPIVMPPMAPQTPRGNKHILRNVLISVGALLLIAAGVALVFWLVRGTPSASKSSQGDTTTVAVRPKVDEQKTFEKDTTASFGFFEVKVVKQTPDYKPANGAKPTQEGYSFLLLNLSVKNIDKDAHLLSDIDFGVLADDTLANPSFIYVSPAIKPGAVSAGAVVTGNMLFEVPTNAKDLKLYYNTQIYSDQDKKLKNIEYTMPL